MDLVVGLNLSVTTEYIAYNTHFLSIDSFCEFDPPIKAIGPRLCSGGGPKRWPMMIATITVKQKQGIQFVYQHH